MVADRATDQFMERALDQIDGLHRLAALLADEPAEAADLVMETYLRASQSSEAYREEGISLRAWLLGILARIARTRARGGGGGVWLAEPRYGAAEQDELLPVHRVLLLLWSVERLSYREMSSVLDLSRDSVMRHLHGARDLVARRLAAGDGRFTRTGPGWPAAPAGR